MAQLEKIMSIYYGTDKLPYKDEDRQTHYPIAGETNTFVGENNTTKVRFFVDRIGGSNYTWVAKVKKPNGTICYRVLEMDNDDYVDVDLSFLYTDQVGQIDLALNGYTARDITITENDGDYEISGNPTVICTGIIKIIINYAPLILNMGATVQPNEYQQILALLSTKISYGIESEKVNELPTTGKANTIYYVKSNESDIVYDIYYWNGTTFAYLGTTAYDLYTKEDGIAFENALRSYVNTQLDNLESEIQQVVSGSPKGVYATLTDLQNAYPTGTSGIYVVSADGHWYYWSGSAWTDGGIYLSTSNAVLDTRKVAGYTLENDITPQELNTELSFSKDILNVDNPNVVSGYYPNSSSTITSSSIHKCLNHIPKSKDLTIKYVVLVTSSITKINVEYLDGTIRPLTYGVLGTYEFSFTNVKAIYINFFSDENGFEVEIDYEDRLSNQVLSATDLPSFKISNSYEITKKDCTDAGRFTLSGTTIGFVASFPSQYHQCAKISVNNRKYLLSYNKGTTATNLVQVIIEYNNGTVTSLLGNIDVSNYKIENAKFLYLNFYGGTSGEFVEKYVLTDNNTQTSSYDDYTDNEYEWHNKKCICAGDSISTDLDGGTSWSNKFATFLNCTMTNLAISGAFYYGGNVKTLLEQITDYNGNKNDIDYVFLAGGTNDYWFSTSLSDFKQAVSDTIDYALVNYPNAKLIVITPIEFNGSSSNAEQLQTYRNIITEVAISKDSSSRISVIQGNKFNFGKIVGNNYTTLMQYDGVHPTQLGLKTAYLKGLLKILNR